jgi:TonB family protein
MRLAILLFCGAFVFGQSTSPAPESKAQPPLDSSGQKPQNQDSGLGEGTHGGLDILSDTQGVDFGPYLQRIVKDVRENWYHLIPESARKKRGKLAIEFAIKKDGKVANMRLVATSGDVALDRPAWGSIAASNPFPPLPDEFDGPYLALRLRFYYNPDETGLEKVRSIADMMGTRSPTKPKSGIAVNISAPADLRVPLGGSMTVTATVTGTEAKENTVDWSLSGVGCSGATCGEMTKDSYHAPTAMPRPPFVTLTAISKADPTSKASVTVHIVQPAPSQ